jgi:hypothetical protein
MAEFVCDHCGKCCRSLGRYIGIERQLSERDYYCKNILSGEVFPVHVAPEFAEEIDEEFSSGMSGSHDGCIFLRKDPKGPGHVCAIHATRPRICREFRCYHMVISNAKGAPVGRMVGGADIQTADPVLARVWNEEVKPLPCPAAPAGDPVWVERVRTILATHGYRVETVESGNI